MKMGMTFLIMNCLILKFKTKGTTLLVNFSTTILSVFQKRFRMTIATKTEFLKNQCNCHTTHLLVGRMNKSYTLLVSQSTEIFEQCSIFNRITSESFFIEKILMVSILII